MSGLRKAKTYDWKDSNLALFGSDVEKNVKKASAGSEKAWHGAGKSVGLQIWRIVKFKVTDWTKQDYGKFYNGDSYIILNTYKKEEELLYDVHFWIGENSTQDEYGTAAYKTVELDTFLDDKPIQHREVAKHESRMFKSYFPEMTVMKGGADTGFRRVEPKEYKPRLLRFQGTTMKNIQVTEMEYVRENVTEHDVFLVDLGLDVYQINGTKCDKDEKFKAVQYLHQLKSERGGKVRVHSTDFDGTSCSRAPLNALPSGDQDEEETKAHTDCKPVLVRLSDESGNLKLEPVSRISKSSLNSNDVFIYDTGDHCYVWTGSKASIDERRKAMQYAHNYLIKTDHPFLPVTCIVEGKETKDFNDAF